MGLPTYQAMITVKGYNDFYPVHFYPDGGPGLFLCRGIISGGWGIGKLLQVLLFKSNKVL
jgi:hypothetical protein